MGFPKELKHAAEITKDQRGQDVSKFLGIPLMLESYQIKPSRSFGALTSLECKNEEGEKVKLSTFSGVIADQAQRLEGLLPLLITVSKVANYYTIY